MGVVTEKRRTKLWPLAAVVLLTVVGLWYFLSDTSHLSNFLSDSYPLRKQVRIDMALSNQTGRNLASAEVRLYGVVAQTPRQKLIRTDVDSPHLQFSDHYQNTAWVFQFSDLPRTASKSINTVIDIGFQEPAIQAGAGDAEQFLQANAEFANAAEVREVLEPMLAANPADSVEKLMAWFRQQQVDRERQNRQSASNTSSSLGESQDPSSSELPVIADPARSVLSVFQGKEWSAVDKVFLFTAMARAAAVPARILVGLRTDAGRTLTFNDVTLWPEVRIEGQWVQVDPDSGTRLANGSSSYLAMRILDPHIDDIRPEPYDYLVETMGVSVAPGSVKVRITEAN